jgi:hypothetical protein
LIAIEPSKPQVISIILKDLYLHMSAFVEVRRLTRLQPFGGTGEAELVLADDMRGRWKSFGPGRIEFDNISTPQLPDTF